MPYTTFVHHHRTMLASIIRTKVRSALLNNGPQSCSALVKSMGLDPKRHKGTIHAIMVDMENDGVLWAELHHKTLKRTKWHLETDMIRKRDRLAAVFM
ncbi:MAG: hypothetical protein VW454_05245 [Pelagibacteraceae bacterium]